MKTITVQIGNTDNKLTQHEWAQLIFQVKNTLDIFANEIHFSGGSSYDAPWQNACFVAEVNDDKLPVIRAMFSTAAYLYKQDSIAMTTGDTEFIEGDVCALQSISSPTRT